MAESERVLVRPAMLYKYRALAGQGLEYLADTVLNNKIWLASPLSFNDPYDCFPVIDLSGSEYEKKSWIKKLVRRNFPRESRKLRLQRVGEISKGFATISEGNTAWRDAINRMGVFCLAQNSTNMLMWSHYAESHHGICLEFDSSYPPFNSAQRMCYVNERPVFRMLDPDRSDLIERVLLRKAEVWEYESEWRIFSAGMVGAVDFPATALISIALGSNVSKAHEAKIRDILAKREHPIAIRRVEIDPKRYTLTLVDVAPT